MPNLAFKTLGGQIVVIVLNNFSVDKPINIMLPRE
ncbi:MAG: hypothetical protein GWP29_07755 [Bacteroidetes bacterium]|nr:hypothetical protein [Flavobacteriaceae bacterium]NCF31758.1 hypothetical protein [Bacteroidota bacterium]